MIQWPAVDEILSGGGVGLGSRSALTKRALGGRTTLYDRSLSFHKSMITLAFGCGGLIPGWWCEYTPPLTAAHDAGLLALGWSDHLPDRMR